MQLAEPDDQGRATKASIQLCVTAEHTQKLKPVGPFFVVLNLRVARLACPAYLAEWVESTLKQIECGLSPSLMKAIELFDTLMGS